MLEFESKDSFNLKIGIVKVVKWFKGFENEIGNTVIIDGVKCEILDAQRNRCCGFTDQYKTEKDWEQRDVWFLIKEKE